MTNVECYQKEAVKKLEKGILDSYQVDFVEKIKNYTKKELNSLTSKQFLFLRKIAEQK